jgi:hypothetical protein
MTAFSRLTFRLRRRALHWYEIGLCTALLAMALAVAVPSFSAQARDDAVQCGNIQSSTVVMQR